MLRTQSTLRVEDAVVRANWPPARAIRSQPAGLCAGVAGVRWPLQAAERGTGPAINEKMGRRAQTVSSEGSLCVPVSGCGLSVTWLRRTIMSLVE
jgi:hypothetical protein